VWAGKKAFIATPNVARIVAQSTRREKTCPVLVLDFGRGKIRCPGWAASNENGSLTQELIEVAGRLGKEQTGYASGLVNE
jgi:hypothetical protein